ncbi:ClpXP protease specificity-enhancing factor [Psychrobium sp. 1_MG-2023]|uniref:ClpXP protease specificity-enhancing factor n=1 Tax=Psychrobium sp. 1_MG-2023 TaxID=3062624 RepID=UPI000C33D76A|nr:ClpXP protease specificity-enhancing factor [Psychrobium sp. 1_MG-2023]MDP2560681.1 ClpXP protease specificity-enhancing factor [Psychrobium sp. 1_MG-2023]PKF56577.1 ClpXP protease specificity-enhancing factor [Alteromonadales bacterium alter-6D02]
MGPNRPYLLRAFYQWLLDNDCTPHLVVNADIPGVQVPLEHVKDGQIVLNIAPHAIGDIEMSNERVIFSARFGGKPFELIIPMAAVLAIYARENGAGTMFEDEPFYHQQLAEEVGVSDLEPLTAVSRDSDTEASVDKSDTDEAKKEPVKKDRSFLKVIK